MIDYDKLQKSLKHLQLQYANFVHAQKRAELKSIDREAIAESVIQRFEICHDTVWKDLKRYLSEDIGLPDVPNSPKPILRLAGKNKLFESPTERWMEYADARTSTAHDYSEWKAKGVLKLVAGFIDDAIALYEKMTGARWK
jgi:nucleotidyltransferase substrate binding protein (TIGR01987 family)